MRRVKRTAAQPVGQARMASGLAMREPGQRGKSADGRVGWSWGSVEQGEHRHPQSRFGEGALDGDAESAGIQEGNTGFDRDMAGEGTAGRRRFPLMIFAAAGRRIMTGHAGRLGLLAMMRHLRLHAGSMVAHGRLAGHPRACHGPSHARGCENQRKQQAQEGAKEANHARLYGGFPRGKLKASLPAILISMAGRASFGARTSCSLFSGLKHGVSKSGQDVRAPKKMRGHTGHSLALS